VTNNFKKIKSDNNLKWKVAVDFFLSFFKPETSLSPLVGPARVLLHVRVLYIWTNVDRSTVATDPNHSFLNVWLRSVKVRNTVYSIIANS
jgi:hypothetical protein